MCSLHTIEYSPASRLCYLGDDSEAAKILRYTVSNDSIRVPNGGVDDSSSLGFDRRAVVNHQDKVTVCKKRVIELKKMLQRNKDQKVCPCSMCLEAHNSDDVCTLLASHIYKET